MKGSLWPSQSFWERDLSVFTCLFSFYISFVLIHEDLSVQMNLSLHTCKLFQAKRNDKVTAQQPLWVKEDTWGPGTSCMAVLFPAHRSFCSFLIQQGHAWHQQNRTWLCLGASASGEAVSLTYLEFCSGISYLSVSPGRLVLTIF